MIATVADYHPLAESGAARPRRILVVVHGFPPRQNSGAELQAYRKARWWHARGHLVSVLAADPQPAADWPFGRIDEAVESLDGMTVRRVRLTAPDATRPLWETFAHPALAAALEREIAEVRPDLIYQVGGYLFGTLPLQLAARHGIASALFAMDYWHTCQRVTLLRPDGACCPGPSDPADCAACRIAARATAQRFGPPANRAIRRVLATTGRSAGHTVLGDALGVTHFAARCEAISETLGTVSLVVVNSRFLANQLARLGVPRKRMLVVRQGIDTDEFAVPPPRPQRRDGLKVLYLGQISWHKGADLAIEAVAQLRATGHRVHLDLHGPVSAPSTYMAELQGRIERIPGDRTVRLGAPLDRRCLVAALRDADVLVVPSRWYENSPNVILEAFAAGVPVVAAHHGGMAEMVRDGVDGLLFTPGDASALAAALRRLSTEPGLLARLRSGIVRPCGLDEEMRIEDEALQMALSHQAFV
jgi:glycosyltransferase involved in cell wall biosynthesis